MESSSFSDSCLFSDSISELSASLSELDDSTSRFSMNLWEFEFDVGEFPLEEEGVVKELGIWTSSLIKKTHGVHQVCDELSTQIPFVTLQKLDANWRSSLTSIIFHCKRVLVLEYGW